MEEAPFGAEFPMLQGIGNVICYQGAMSQGAMSQTLTLITKLLYHWLIRI